MSFGIKDPVFSHKGMPGVVTKKTEFPEQLMVEGDEKVVQSSFRHGYVKGLNADMRDEFNSIMDDIKSQGNANDKVHLLQSKISQLEEDTTKNNHRMVNYLKAELFHLMTTENYRPNQYSISPSRTP